MAKLVSKIYGDALFELALEQNKLAEMTEEVHAVKEALTENPELMQLFQNPDVNKPDKLELVERVFKGRVSDDMTGFLHVVVSKERTAELVRILDYFDDRQKAYNKIGVATVTAPIELNGEWKEKIEKKLLETTDFVKMEMHFETDPSLIGGLVIRIGDTVVDSSIKSKLEELQHKLMNVSVA